MAEFESIYDCIIVGGGPGGLTCAVFLGRYRRRVLLCHNNRPRNYASQAIHGFLGQHGIRPAELLSRGGEEAREAGVEMCECTVESIERIGDAFEVRTSSGTMRGRRIVLAYGLRDELPDIPGVEAYYGRSVFHCPDCDAFELSEKRIGVIGWGRNAGGLALRLLQWTAEVTIFVHGRPRDFDEELASKLQAETVNVKDERILSLEGTNGELKAVVLESGERVELDALFFNIDVRRSCDLGEQLGCVEVTDTPCFSVDEYGETSVEGVYAIGDISPGSQLAITAAADGAVAAIAINKSLLPPSRKV